MKKLFEVALVLLFLMASHVPLLILAANKIQNNYAMAIAILLITLSAASIMLFYTYRRIIVPIRYIAEVMESISTGHIDFELNDGLKQQTDEIGKLAQSFSRMLASLKLAMRMTAPELQKANEKISHNLVESEKRVANITRTLNESSIVSITDVQGNITYVNDKFVEISKYSREELIGKNHRLVKSNFHTKEFYEALWKTISSGNIWVGELRNRAKDTSIYWVRSVIMPNTENGRVVGYTAIRTPITDLMQPVEDAIKRQKSGENIPPEMLELIDSFRTGKHRQYSWSK